MCELVQTRRADATRESSEPRALHGSFRARLLIPYLDVTLKSCFRIWQVHQHSNVQKNYWFFRR